MFREITEKEEGKVSDHFPNLSIPAVNFPKGNSTIRSIGKNLPPNLFTSTDKTVGIFHKTPKEGLTLC
jgi:hypothetical protein